MFNSIGSLLESTFGNFYFLFAIEVIAFSFKLFLILILIHRIFSKKITKKTCLLLLLVLLGGLFEDCAWIMHLLPKLFFPELSRRLIHLSIQVAWIFDVIRYQALALFIENLVEKNKLSNRQRIFLVISFCFIAIMLILSFNPFKNIELQKTMLHIMYRIFALYSLLLMFSSIVFTIKKFKSPAVPRIVKKQLAILIKVIIVPYLTSEFIQIYPSIISDWSNLLAPTNYAFISVSSALLTYAVFYCARKMMGLRFLNIHKHVRAPVQFSFIDNFKDVFEQLNNALSPQEIIRIIQKLFKDAFTIPIHSVKLYLRPFDASICQDYSNNDQKAIFETVENTINTEKTELSEAIKKSKILIYDELDFNNFYETNTETTTILQFLESINADIFLPIRKHQKIVAYIIIERYARLNEFYNDVERDEMLVLANYLGTILHLMQNRDLDMVIAKEKEMCEELYNKHQEINQYKESIRSFLHHSKKREIGILFYKNRRFTFGNRAAKKLLEIDPNTQEGHPLIKQLRQLVRNVESYKSDQTSFSHDAQGNKLILSAIQNLESNNIIIHIYYPEVSDILTKQMELLKDPSKWDYLLYLETTNSGCLINQLIPGSGEQLLNFKIELLKTSLSIKATLLQFPQEDLIPMVELLHHISLRTNLHILNLQAPEGSMEVAIKLFGISQIFGINNKEEPLLKKLNKTGTLFIQNIHFLNLETQKYLAELIRFGFYRIFKTEQHVPCDVRIICSTNRDLKILANDGDFSQNLLAELQKVQLSMPSLLTLPEEELNELAEGYSEQNLKKQTFKGFLELTEKEHKKLTSNRPSSLQELKIKVQQLLIKKSKKNKIYDETLFDPAYTVNDPQLVEAARLGKQALKDPQIMSMLWNKFKNQNKIATFLGVNRSSVNRRCKEYNFILSKDTTKQSETNNPPTTIKKNSQESKQS